MDNEQLINLHNNTRDQKLTLIFELTRKGYQCINVEGEKYYIHPNYFSAAKNHSSNHAMFTSWNIVQPREAVFHV